MPDRPACCVCPPGCPGATTTPAGADPDITIAACIDAGCSVCIHGCPSPTACCHPAALPAAEVGIAHQAAVDALASIRATVLGALNSRGASTSLHSWTTQQLVEQLITDRDQWRRTAREYNAAVNDLAADNDRLGAERDQLAAALTELQPANRPRPETVPPVGTHEPYRPGALTPYRRQILQAARDGKITRCNPHSILGWHDTRSYYHNPAADWLIRHGLAAPHGADLIPTAAGLAALNPPTTASDT